MKVVQLHEYTLTQIFNPTITPTIAHWGPKKSKTSLQIIQNQTSKLNEIMIIKIVQLDEKTPQ